MDNLFAAAISAIKLVYGATTLDEYLSHASCPNFLEADPGDHIAVVILARKYNVPELLPVAFYRASELTVGKIMGGYSYHAGASRRRRYDGPLRVDLSNRCTEYTIGVRISQQFEPATASRLF